MTGLIGETSSTLGASSLKNFSSVGSSHSLSEAMLLVSLSFLGLVCSFHDLHLLVKLLTSFSYIKDDHTKAEYIISQKNQFVNSFFYISKNKYIYTAILDNMLNL